MLEVVNTYSLGAAALLLQDFEMREVVASQMSSDSLGFASMLDTRNELLEAF